MWLTQAVEQRMRRLVREGSPDYARLEAEAKANTKRVGPVSVDGRRVRPGRNGRNGSPGAAPDVARGARATPPAAGGSSLRGRGIVCLSSIDWDFNWQGHQQIMSALAARGNHVLFVENTGVRAPIARDLPRLVARVRNRWRSRGALRRGSGTVSTSTRRWRSRSPTRGLARAVNRTLVLRRRAPLDAGDGRRAAAPLDLPPDPAGAGPDRRVPPRADRVLLHRRPPGDARRAPGRSLPSETRLFREADLVFVTAERLRARAAAARSQVDVFPFGVDMEPFEHARDGSGAAARGRRVPPAPDRGVRRRGEALDRRGAPDRGRGADAARQLRPRRAVGTDASTTRPAPATCTSWGRARHADVPRDYLKAFDVAIIPYRLAKSRRPSIRPS